MVAGNHSAAEVAAQIRKESWEAVGSANPLFTPEDIRKSISALLDESVASLASRPESALERAEREQAERESREVYESPNWFRPGTERYFAEAMAAGYYGVDEATGEAYRKVEPQPSPPRPGSLVWDDVKGEPAMATKGRILVRANLPHIDEQTDGALGPIVDLAYEWVGVGLVKPGMVVWCPPTPNGPPMEFPAVVVTCDPEKIAYKGPVRQVVLKLSASHPEYAATFGLIHNPASTPKKGA